ncbi:hypothetical protein [Pseudarthrobacter sp. NBSH8]|uniref:hypothetical protein n=1 Tax=Pseudarthrobacter sp. NBSH8 TaxID=2596911 RepID=UPI001625EFEB|nr:hypothetical protein [Pseudarthrobacter sp. NBSH8]QNE13841.1 hypothetical protein FYJ92_04820 [Pseudarthrobacter sp. NBSH8]
MRAPTAPDSHVKNTTVVSTEHSNHVLTQRDMVAKASAGHPGSAQGPGILRVVPLLRVSGEKGRRVVLVGHSCLSIQDIDHAAVESFVTNAWVEGADDGEFVRVTVAEASTNEQVQAATAEFNRELPEWPDATSVTDNQLHIAKHAKALAELSRNAVASVREIRYDLEHRLAHFSSKSHPTTSNTPIVASLLELNIICGRAADEAREAVREGLWLHLSDPEAYHSYRRLQDPSIINDAAAATSTTRSWMRLHDAAVRQCLEMRKQLDAESGSARDLMAAAASVSNSREADSQAAFNTLAAVASLGLGIPALVLALYGADRLLPLDTEPRQLAFIPVAAGLLLAAVIAIWRAPKGKSSRIWIVGAIGIIMILLALLVAAGLLAPSS